MLSLLAAAQASAAPAPLCSKAGCPWDTLPYNCTSTQLLLTFRTTLHYSGVVNCGNLFVDIDLGAANDEHTYPEHAYYTPDVQFPPADPKKLYTFIMVDPDGNTKPPYHWPDALPGDLAIARHWVVGNIPGDRLATGFRGNVEATFESIATVVAPYVSPRPFHGSHRYGQFVFEQPGPITFAKMRNRDAFGERFHWNVTGSACLAPRQM